MRPDNRYFSDINTDEKLIALIDKVITGISTGPNAYHKVNLNRPTDTGYRRVTNLINRLRVSVDKLVDPLTQSSLKQEIKTDIVELLCAGIAYQNSRKKVLSHCIYCIIADIKPEDKCRDEKIYLENYEAFLQATHEFHQSFGLDCDEILDVACELEELIPGDTSLFNTLPTPQWFYVMTKQAIDEYIRKEVHGNGMEGSLRALHLKMELEKFSFRALENHHRIQKKLMTLLCSVVLKHGGNLGRMFLIQYASKLSLHPSEAQYPLIQKFQSYQRHFNIADTTLERINKWLAREQDDIEEMDATELQFLLNQMRAAVHDYKNENTEQPKPHDALGMARAERVLAEIEQIQKNTNIENKKGSLSALIFAIVHYSTSSALKRKLIHYTGIDRKNGVTNRHRYCCFEIARALDAVTLPPLNGWPALYQDIVSIAQDFQRYCLSENEKSQMNFLMSKLRETVILNRDQRKLSYYYQHVHQLIRLFYSLIKSELPWAMRLTQQVLFLTNLNKETVIAWATEHSVGDAINLECTIQDPFLASTCVQNNYLDPKWCSRFSDALRKMQHDLQPILIQIDTEQDAFEKQKKFALMICAFVMKSDQADLLLDTRELTLLRDRMLLYVQLSYEQVKEMQVCYGFSDSICLRMRKKILENANPGLFFEGIFCRDITQAFWNGLNAAATNYVFEKKGVQGPGLSRANNLLLHLEKIDSATPDGKKQLVLLAAAVVLYTSQGDLREKILTATKFPEAELQALVDDIDGRTGIFVKSIKRMAVDLAPPKNKFFEQKKPRSSEQELDQCSIMGKCE